MARRGARPGPHSDRLQLAGSIATSVALLTVVHQHGDWLEVSSDFWSVAVGLVSGCALIALWRGRWLPTTAGEQTVWLRRLSAAVSFGLAATLVGIMAA